MLAASAAERYHQVFEAAALVFVEAGIDQGHDTGKKLMDGLLLVQIVDAGGVLAGKRFETLLASGIRKATAIENKAAAISGFVFRQAAVEGKGEDSNRQTVCFGSQRLQLLGGQHAVESFHQRGQRDWQLYVMREPAQVFQGVWDTLQKVCLALIKAAKSVSSQRLQNADVNIGIVMMQEFFATYCYEAGKCIDVKIEKLLAE